MNSRLAVFSYCIAAGLLLRLDSHAAKVISVSITPSESAMDYTGDIAGAPGVRVIEWSNALTGGGGSTFVFNDGELYDSDSQPVSGLTISIYTGNGGSTSTRGNPPGGTAPALENDGRMLRTVTDKFQGEEGVIAVRGVPFSKYTLYFYAYPDAGGGGERGGYFTLTTTNGTDHTRWLKGGEGANSTIPLPDPATGDGYVVSTTSTQPATFDDIDPGHYVSIPGLTDSDVDIRYSAVGGGAGNVAGGDGARRLKFAGFQIVEASSGQVTELRLDSAIPELYAGNPQGFTALVLAVRDDGSSEPLRNLEGAVFASTDPEVVTVSGQGVVYPGRSGTARLEATYEGLSLSEPVTVLQPTAVRPLVSADPIFLGAFDVPISLLADFPDGAVDVDVSGFQSLLFSGGPAGVVQVTPEGLLTAVGVGDFYVAATYDGVSGETNPAGTILPYDPPQPEDGLVSLGFNLLSGQGMAFNDLAGVPGVRAGYWNNVADMTAGGTAVLGAGSVRDSTGAVMSTLQVEATGGTGGPSTRGAQDGNESTMFYGVYDQFDGVPGTLVLEGIPFGTYDAYFYVLSGDANNRVGHFTIGDETRWIRNSQAQPIPDNEGNGYLEAETTSVPASVNDVDPGNYVRFEGLRGSSLSVEFVADGSDVLPDSDGAPRLKFAGLQLVGAPAHRLTDVSLAPGPQSIDLTWSAFVGKIYDIAGSATPLDPDGWNPVITNIVADSHTLTQSVPMSAGYVFRTEQRDPPPFFADDFENSANPQWTAINASGTGWAKGTPNTDTGFAQVVGANSGSQAWGTGLTSGTDADTNVTLTSPAFEVPSVDAAVLEWYQATDLDDDPASIAEVFGVIESTQQEILLYTAPNGEAGSDTSWHRVRQTLDPALRDQTIRIRFRLVTPADAETDFWAGWYIDDVVVKLP